jgi:hypothetical protein
MNLNGNHIIDFAMNRWKLTKNEIDKKYLACNPYALSRKKPPRIDAALYFNSLFDLNNKKSAASEAKDDKMNILGALKDYMIKAELPNANYIDTKIKQSVDYERIILEILRRADMQPFDIEQQSTPQS